MAEVGDWASLDGNILGLVFRRLQLPDAIRSAAACNQWWRVAAESRDPELPWIWKTWTREFYSFSDDRVYSLDLPADVLGGECVGSYEEWMIICSWEGEGTQRHLKHFLFNPFSATRIELPQVYHWWCRRILVSLPPTSPDCLAAHLYANRRMGFCRLIGEESKWTMLQKENEENCDDIIFHNQSIYVATNAGELKLVEISSLPDTPLKIRAVLPPPPVQADPLDLCCYKLLECKGELLMSCYVCDSQRLLTRIAVFQANLRFRRWEEVESLGSQTIILSREFRTITTAAETLGIEGDCIYDIWDVSTAIIFRVREKSLKIKTSFDIWPSPFRDFDSWITPNPWRRGRKEVEGEASSQALKA